MVFVRFPTACAASLLLCRIDSIVVSFLSLRPCTSFPPSLESQVSSYLALQGRVHYLQVGAEATTARVGVESPMTTVLFVELWSSF